MERIDVLTFVDTEIAFVIGAIKIILFKWITSESRERFSVDRFLIDKMISANSSFPVTNVGSNSSCDFSAENMNSMK